MRSTSHKLDGEPGYTANIANCIAEGDLAVEIELRANDEASLLFTIKQMRDKLHQIVTDVRRGTDNINAASTEIAAGNQNLSSRTEQQAGSLEETASSMEELTSTVKQNADNARQAVTLAHTAAEVAGKGGTGRGTSCGRRQLNAKPGQPAGAGGERVSTRSSTENPYPD